jgi:hypothetical protein
VTAALDPRRARDVERMDSRVLGAVRFVDAVTGRRIESPLEVAAPGAALLRNRSGAFVVTAAPGLTSHVTEFAAPPDPPPAFGGAPITLSVRDPGGRYLARQVKLPLPRDPDQAAPPNAAGSLFTPVLVRLYPTPAATIYPGWAVLRVSVARASNKAGLPGVWLRLRFTADAANAAPRAAGMSDERGEALVVVPGVPVTNWDAANTAVLSFEMAAVLDAYFDATASSPPDPDVIDGKRSTLPTVNRALMLAPGRENVVRLELNLP